MDTRESCKYIKNSLVNGFTSCEVSCECIEVVSTLFVFLHKVVKL